MRAQLRGWLAETKTGRCGAREIGGRRLWVAEAPRLAVEEARWRLEEEEEEGRVEVEAWELEGVEEEVVLVEEELVEVFVLVVVLALEEEEEGDKTRASQSRPSL